MSLKFLNLPKILIKLNVQYIGTPYGSYGVSDSPEFAKKLRKKRLWVAINEDNELKASRDLLCNGNNWLDQIAHMKDNRPEEFEELIKC